MLPLTASKRAPTPLIAAPFSLSCALCAMLRCAARPAPPLILPRRAPALLKPPRAMLNTHARKSLLRILYCSKGREGGQKGSNRSRAEGTNNKSNKRRRGLYFLAILVASGLLQVKPESSEASTVMGTSTGSAAPAASVPLAGRSHRRDTGTAAASSKRAGSVTVPGTPSPPAVPGTSRNSSWPSNAAAGKGAGAFAGCTGAAGASPAAPPPGAALPGLGLVAAADLGLAAAGAAAPGRPSVPARSSATPVSVTVSVPPSAIFLGPTAVATILAGS